MYSSSTQRKYWMFSDESEINRQRRESNANFVEKFGSNLDEEQRAEHFLTHTEERMICRHFEYVLKEFCTRFQPPMPKYVLGTALCYFKRFYINNSAMDYHPKDIMLTCVYLACKVEEFNVSIAQFVGNLRGDREAYANTVLSFELLLMDKLHYHLTVHNPYRPLEGFFIDIKTRSTTVENVERYRKGAEEFLDKTLSTDACLMFAPSQIALCAIVVSSNKDSNLESYISETLLKGYPKEEKKKTASQVKKLKAMVKSLEPYQKDQMGAILKKLEGCRNQENNPESDIYKRKLQEMLDEDEDLQTRKRQRICKEERAQERELAESILDD